MRRRYMRRSLRSTAPTAPSPFCAFTPACTPAFLQLGRELLSEPVPLLAQQMLAAEPAPSSVQGKMQHASRAPDPLLGQLQGVACN